MSELPKVAQSRLVAPGKRRARFSKSASAAQSIRGFEPGSMVTCLTFGQFSLIDLVQAALQITGPAHVTISTWSAGFYDANAAKNFRDSGAMLSLRFVMDAGQQKRGQATQGQVAELFGAENVRTARSHAKFVTIKNDAWSIAITSSMNLNLNQRVEQFMMVDDAETCGLFLDFVDALFAERSDGDLDPHGMPVLFGLEEVAPLSIECTRVIERGPRPTIGVFGD